VQLSEIIKQKISAEGPISFCEFMEMALYHPGLGYYTSATEKIGRLGDYYTSPVLTPVFGSMIARQIEEMWERLGKNEFTIVEYGAGTGALCHDILMELKNNERLYSGLKYCIIEKSETMRQKEKSLLTEKVTWHESINEIGDVTGCVLSNELVDNFAVHKVVMENELMEIFVDHKNDFVETCRPASQALKEYISEQNIKLSNNYRTEINLQALEWITGIAKHLKRGFVLTIDYGYQAPELYCTERNSGTMMCYHHHKINRSPYNNVGEQDITAHVNFSALNNWGAKNGLEFAGFSEQGLFLRSLGLVDHLRKTEREGSADRKKLLEAHTLLWNMGQKFKVLIQQKDVGKETLSGMSFSQRLD
jgi:SAM-dependent MidA family methyltransferase